MCLGKGCKWIFFLTVLLWFDLIHACFLWDLLCFVAGMLSWAVLQKWPLWFRMLLLEVPAPAVTFPWITTGAFKAELKSSWLVPCWNRWIPVPSVLLTGQKAGNSWRAEASLLISLRPCVEGSKALHPVCLELEDPEHSPTPKERKFPINSFSKKTLLPHLFDHVLLDFFVLLLSSLVFVAPLNSISSFQINFFILRRIFKFYL